VAGSPELAHLRRAKRYLMRHGWRQGIEALDPYDDRVCAASALVRTRDESEGRPAWNENTAFTLFWNAIRVPNTRSPFTGSSIGAWNDAPGRTVKEVFAAFDRAIESITRRPG
jgi:hypothetical protein